MNHHHCNIDLNSNISHKHINSFWFAYDETHKNESNSNLSPDLPIFGSSFEFQINIGQKNFNS